MEKNEIKVMTICFLVKGDENSRMVCLAEKKRGYRVGKINGFGGKVEKGETIYECALRETREESSVIPRSLAKCAEIYFYDPVLTHECHVYVSLEWEGEPVETEEMLPAWYQIKQIPFDRMGQADPLWLPPVLQGHKVIANFYYDERGGMYKNKIRIVEEF